MVTRQGKRKDGSPSFLSSFPASRLGRDTGRNSHTEHTLLAWSQVFLCILTTYEASFPGDKDDICSVLKLLGPQTALTWSQVWGSLGLHMTSVGMVSFS